MPPPGVFGFPGDVTFTVQRGSVVGSRAATWAGDWQPGRAR